MGKKIDITGHSYNKLTVIREVEPYISPKGQKQTKWVCLCECGETKEIVGAKLRDGNTISCGCYKKKQTTQRNTTHGDCKTKEYKTWASIKSRCLNSKDMSFTDYGGRGITICPEWINSFETFLKDVGRAPGPEYSIDRIDVNGNYEPSNVRWATKVVQGINRRTQSNNTSGHKGVHWHRKSNKWEARITVKKRRIHLGIFSTKEEAIAARLEAEEIYHKPLLEKN